MCLISNTVHVNVSSDLSVVVSVGQCVVTVCVFVFSVYVLLCALQETPLCFNACLG